MRGDDQIGDPPPHPVGGPAPEHDPLHVGDRRLIDRRVADDAGQRVDVRSARQFEGGAEQFASELAASDLVCGVAIGADAQSMAYAIPEALEALHEAIRWRRTVHIDEIATLDGLLAAVPKVRLVPFVHRLLVPLVDHDKGNNSYLVSSLEAFLAPGNDLSTAANQLYVHVNTLRNRLAKIAELTGANPLDETDRVNFRIALWAAHNMGMSDGAGSGTTVPSTTAKPRPHNGFGASTRGRRMPPRTN